MKEGDYIHYWHQKSTCSNWSACFDHYIQYWCNWLHWELRIFFYSIELTWFQMLEHFNLWNVSKGESFFSCTRHKVTGDISQCPCMPQNKSCHVVKQGDRVLGKSFNDSSCLWNSLPKWLSPCLTLQQCCQLAVAHGRWKKMTGSFNYVSSLHITLLKWLSPSLTMQ